MPGLRKSQDTWERILESAETLFAGQGYSGTSTRQIAAAADVSIQTLQYHCGGKKNLYQAVLERTVIPVTDLINRYVQKMLEQDLTDERVLEESVARIIDELFDLLQAKPNYGPIFYRQWLVQDPDLRSVEWENLIPLLRNWAEKIETQLGEERLRGTNLLLMNWSMSWIYWGLFVQPSFLARYMGIDADSPEFLRIVKDHAWEMTLRMMGQRRSSSPSPFRKKKTGARKKTETGKKKMPTGKKK
jgi:AcrR family transcriptional regulator